MAWVIHPLVPSELVIELSRMTYLRNSGRSEWLPCPFFVIKNDEEAILVDTSGSAADMTPLRAEPVRDRMSFSEALDRVGLEPVEIKTVIVTHLMYDHIANAKLLPNAEFVVQKAELEYANDPHPLFAGAYQAQLFEDLNFHVIEGDYKLRPGIELLLTPGHSAGCQSVAVATTAGKVVITGFCCIGENFEPGEGAWVSDKSPEVIPPGIHLDMRAGYDSAVRVKEMADIILAMHDPSLLTIKRIPQ